MEKKVRLRAKGLTGLGGVALERRVCVMRREMWLPGERLPPESRSEAFVRIDGLGIAGIRQIRRDRIRRRIRVTFGEYPVIRSMWRLELFKYLTCRRIRIWILLHRTIWNSRPFSFFLEYARNVGCSEWTYTRERLDGNRRAGFERFKSKL